MKPYLNLIAVVAAIASFSVGCAGTTDPAAVTTIGGTVTDRATGTQIVNANITTFPPTESVMTDSAGSYTLNYVLPDTYTLTVQKPGYVDGSVDVVVGAGKKVIADVQIDSMTAAMGRGAALRYDGVNDYVSVAHTGSLDLSGGSFTVEAWVDPTRLSIGSSLWNVILNKSHVNADLDYLLGLDNEGRFCFMTRSASNFLLEAPGRT